MKARIYSRKMKKFRGEVEIELIGPDMKITFCEPLPPGTRKGDRLVFADAPEFHMSNRIGTWHGLARH